jgi:murein DD-endopeptidase MepM/ murein hydrolase activator NlpD
MNRDTNHLTAFAAAAVLIALAGYASFTLPTRAAEAPTDQPPSLDSGDDPDDLARYGRLDERIRAAARRDRIPAAVADELIRLFTDDIDLRRAAHPRDGFVVVIDAAQRHPGDSDIVFASLTFGGSTESLYRFATPGGGVGYFDRAGRSADKQLIRRPLDAGWLNSTFGIKRHPILGYTRMHTGVDWEAPLGTPIYAAGAGTVEAAGQDGGYGERVRLRHDGGYETAYAHLFMIARGLAPGVKVERGQVIGSVGSAGISTGPHLHYEVLVDGRFVDPMRIRLPARHVLADAALDDFTIRSARVDADAARAAPFHPLLASK